MLTWKWTIRKLLAFSVILLTLMQFRHRIKESSASATLSASSPAHPKPSSVSQTDDSQSTAEYLWLHMLLGKPAACKNCVFSVLDWRQCKGALRQKGSIVHWYLGLLSTPAEGCVWKSYRSHSRNESDVFFCPCRS